MGMLEELGGRLVTAGILTAAGTDLFYNFMPDSPDEVTSLYEVPGVEDRETMGDTLPDFEIAQFEVHVRAGEHDHPTARARCDNIWKNLNLILNETVGGTRYLRVARLGSPELDLVDVKGRPTFTINFEAWREV